MFKHGEYRYPDACIVIMARTPEYGRVKTRLAAGIGADAALSVYRQLLERTLHTVTDSHLAPVELHIDGDMMHPLVQKLAVQTGAKLVAQQGGDLGERMYHALDQALHNRDSALIIGSDCPIMDAAYIESALQVLANGTDIVVGPSEDGGYVLIGGTRVNEQLFQGISWGCDSVMQQTRTALCNTGMTYTELEVLWDVDYPEDYRRWQEVSQTSVN